MPTNLKEQIAADASAVFLNADEFAESVTHYPRGGQVEESVTGVVEIDEGGPAEILDDANGTILIRRAAITLAASVSVTVAERSELRSRFLIRNQMWTAVGLDGVDVDLQTVRLERREKVTSRQTRPG